MFNILKLILRTPASCLHSSSRTFLSQAYYCEEVWEHRLKHPILSKVNLNELYQDLDQRYVKSNQISPVDVDIFVNTITDETYIDEMADVVHKLRLSASASKILVSTSHAVVRFLMQHKKYDELLKLLNDRLNYGIFLDYYTSNLLMDTFYKSKDFVSGARVATHLMLQEELDHPISTNLALLHCYKFLTSPEDFPQEEQVIEEPEEEIKVRVKYLRNPYFDDHFDLSDSKQLVGKTLWMLTRGSDTILGNSLHVLGLELHGKTEEASENMKRFASSNKKLYADILKLLPEDSNVRKSATNLSENGNVEEELVNNVKNAERKIAEKDVSLQCEMYLKWEQQRKDALEEQYEKLMVQEKLANIENIQKELKERETKLWFFDNEEKIELAIEARKMFYPKRWHGKKKKPKNVDEGYIPPEV